MKLKRPKINYTDIPHKVYVDYDHHTRKKCKGRTSYDEVLEGNVCDKCHYYDGVK